LSNDKYFQDSGFVACSQKVRDGGDSYLIEDGKILAQTIHYTVEHK
jgi:hypothetical protein